MANLLSLVRQRILRRKNNDHPVAVVMGLGNPGREYVGTRHNVGFWVIDELVSRLRLGWAEGDLMLTAEAVVSERKLLIVKPLTWMNRSGRAATSLETRLDRIEQFTVVYDDVDLEPGQIRIRASGSSGGHRGMQSVIDALGTEEISRVRVGVGRPRSTAVNTADWVLSEPTGDALDLIRSAVVTATDALHFIHDQGIELAMQKYN